MIAMKWAGASGKRGHIVQDDAGKVAYATLADNPRPHDY